MNTLQKIALAGLLLVAGRVHAEDVVHYYYTDPQGTVLAKTDATGSVIASYDYAPYGSQALGTPPNGPGYTGHVNDPDTGLVYMQARYYDPSTGRFLSTDPIGPAPGNLFNFNRFAYTNNNPINHTDPNGRAPDTDFGLGAMARSAGANPDQMKPALPFAIGALADLTGVGEIAGAIKVVSMIRGVFTQAGKGIDAAKPAKSAVQAGADLAKDIGHNRVSARTAGGQKIDIDLAGKGHFDKATGKVVETPHVHTSDLNVGPNGKVSASNSTVRPATMGDIRTAQKILEHN